MTKNELAKELAVSSRLPISVAFQAVDGTIRIIKETLVRGEEITIRGLGTLAPADVPARTARHFGTGQPLPLPAHRTVRFRPGKDLRLLLNPSDKINNQ